MNIGGSLTYLFQTEDESLVRRLGFGGMMVVGSIGVVPFIALMGYFTRIVRDAPETPPPITRELLYDGGRPSLVAVVYTIIHSLPFIAVAYYLSDYFGVIFYAFLISYLYILPAILVATMTSDGWFDIDEFTSLLFDGEHATIVVILLTSMIIAGFVLGILHIITPGQSEIGFLVTLPLTSFWVGTFISRLYGDICDDTPRLVQS